MQQQATVLSLSAYGGQDAAGRRRLVEAVRGLADRVEVWIKEPLDQMRRLPAPAQQQQQQPRPPARPWRPVPHPSAPRAAPRAIPGATPQVTPGAIPGATPGGTPEVTPQAVVAGAGPGLEAAGPLQAELGGGWGAGVAPSFAGSAGTSHQLGGQSGSVPGSGASAHTLNPRVEAWAAPAGEAAHATPGRAATPAAPPRAAVQQLAGQPPLAGEYKGPVRPQPRSIRRLPHPLQPQPQQPPLPQPPLPPPQQLPQTPRPGHPPPLALPQQQPPHPPAPPPLEPPPSEPPPSKPPPLEPPPLQPPLKVLAPQAPQPAGSPHQQPPQPRPALRHWVRPPHSLTTAPPPPQPAPSRIASPAATLLAPHPQRPPQPQRPAQQQQQQLAGILGYYFSSGPRLWRTLSLPSVPQHAHSAHTQQHSSEPASQPGKPQQLEQPPPPPPQQQQLEVSQPGLEAVGGTAAAGDPGDERTSKASQGAASPGQQRRPPTPVGLGGEQALLAYEEAHRPMFASEALEPLDGAAPNAGGRRGTTQQAAGGGAAAESAQERARHVLHAPHAAHDDDGLWHRFVCCALAAQAGTGGRTPGEQLQGTQRSEEWLQLREGRLTASSLANAIGWFGYTFDRRLQEVVKLWEEKLGLRARTPANDAMRYGQAAEEPALCSYQALVPWHQVQQRMFTMWADDGPHGWLGASPDGLLVPGNPPPGDSEAGGSASAGNGGNGGGSNNGGGDEAAEVPSWLRGEGHGVLEIKCPFKAQNAPLPGVAAYYMPQVQMLLEVHNLDWCNVFYWSPNHGSYIVQIRRDREYWGLLWQALADFWWQHVAPARIELRHGVDPNLVRQRYMPTALHPYADLIRTRSEAMVAAAPQVRYSVEQTRAQAAAAAAGGGGGGGAARAAAAASSDVSGDEADEPGPAVPAHLQPSHE